MSEIRRTRTYDAPVDRIWPLLSTSEGLASWLMPNDLVAEVGHRFTLQADPAPGFDGIVRAEVLEVDPPRRIRFTWTGGGVDTQVSFTLTPLEGDRTKLEFAQTGFRGIRAQVVRLILANGWKGLLAQDLPQALSSTPSGD
jgi:uncharacterized protein YndB with AHSA1/START domain